MTKLTNLEKVQLDRVVVGANKLAAEVNQNKELLQAYLLGELELLDDAEYNEKFETVKQLVTTLVNGVQGVAQEGALLKDHLLN